jgi:hypothetical protein
LVTRLVIHWLTTSHLHISPSFLSLNHQSCPLPEVFWYQSHWPLVDISSQDLFVLCSPYRYKSLTLDMSSMSTLSRNCAPCDWLLWASAHYSKLAAFTTPSSLSSNRRSLLLSLHFVACRLLAGHNGTRGRCFRDFLENFFQAIRR